MKLIQSTTFLGLQDQTSGEIFRVKGEDWDRSNPSMLTLDPAYPYYRARSHEDYEALLEGSPPAYNATTYVPQWGGFSREALCPVQVQHQLSAEPVAVKPPVTLETVEFREIPYIAARRYAGSDFDNGNKLKVGFWLVRRPAGLEADVVGSLEGTVVRDKSRVFKRKVLKALAVPEDYLDMFEPGQGLLLLTNEAP